MNINDQFPSKWLKASDLQGKEIVVTIDRVAMESMQEGQGETKPVIYFAGKEKGLVCNKTNAGAITAAYGQETDGWHGKKIVLFSQKVSFQGQITDGLRVRAHVPVVDETDGDEPPF